MVWGSDSLGSFEEMEIPNGVPNENVQGCYPQVILAHPPTPKTFGPHTAEHQVWLDTGFYSKLGELFGAP